jgi:uncharacterized membrane protein YfcA
VSLNQKQIGLLGGFFSGLLGIGGGSIFIPALTLIEKIDQKTAQGTALVLMSGISLMGFVFYYILHPFALNTIAPYIAGGMIGSWLGSLLAHRLSNSFLKKSFSLYLGFAGLWMILQ